jgi:alanyl-tRNA synthetase
MTYLRFYDDPYETEYTARITSVEEGKNGCLVTLDQTIFYPEGGGQPSDRGWINDIPVTFVEKREGTVVHHLSRQPVGEKAECRLDWQHRFDYMQQHTGQHILSGVMYREFGYNTVAVHQGDEYTTIEIDTPSVEEEEIQLIEKRAMEIISGNLPVETRWIREDETGAYDLRREPKVSGDIRVVSLKGYDSVACGGVHTASAGEVGLVKHIQTEKIRGRVRLYWKIGDRAMADYRLKNTIVASLVERFSAQPPELLQRVEASIDELTTARRQANLLESRLAACAARQLIEEGRVVRTPRGEMVFIAAELQDEGKDFLKKTAEALPEDRRWAFCGMNRLQDSFQWILAVSEGVEFDFNRHRKELMAPVDGKGGGRPPVWQGIAARVEGAGEFFALFEKILRAD